MQEKLYKRVVGGIGEDRERARKDLASHFGKIEIDPSFFIEKDSKLLRLQQQVQEEALRMAHGWGGEVGPLPDDHIFFCAKGKVQEVTGDQFEVGFADLQSMTVIIDIDASAVITEGHLAHEFFHLLSNKSWQTLPLGLGAAVYRTGMSMMRRYDVDPENRRGDEPDFNYAGFQYFKDLEEAIVEESAIRLLRQRIPHSTEPELVATVRMLDYVQGLPKNTRRDTLNPEEIRLIRGAEMLFQEVLDEYSNASPEDIGSHILDRLLEDESRIVRHGRQDERKRMYEILDRIAATLPERFSSRD